ncbi:MAG TPA: hypothetical protein VIX59_12230 [Candidatus Binataceae bacterium]
MAILTIAIRLRFIAAIAPAVLLVAGLLIAGAFYVFGGIPRAIYDNQYTALRNAQAMENGLYKMDWARSQAESKQIIEDQQRGFVSSIGSARDRADSREQLDLIEKIARTANPLFDSLRKVQPGDDSLEPQMRDLETLVTQLVGADEASLLALGAQAESNARIMIAITVVAAIVIPWICFLILNRMTAALALELREIRRRVENLAGHLPAPDEDLKAIDAALAGLGFPKPNPMLAE